MSRRIVAAIVTHPLSVLLAVVLVVLLGSTSLFRIPLSALPTLPRPSIYLRASLPAASMENIDHELAPLVEGQLLALPGCDTVTAWSKDGMLAAEVAFTWGVDEVFARMQVVEALTGMTMGEQPVSFEVSLARDNNRPDLLLCVAGNVPFEQRTTIAEDILAPTFAAVSGVDRIEILGGARRLFVVEPELARCMAHGIPLGAIRTALRDWGQTQLLAEVTFRGARVEVTTAGGIDSATLLTMLPVKCSGDRTVPLVEVATIRDSSWPEHGALHVNGRPAVGVAISLAGTANALRASRDLKAKLSELSEKLPIGTRIEVVIDETENLKEALLGVVTAGLIGAILAGLALGLFVRQIGPLFALLLSVPLSIFAALPVFEALGLGLNLVSLAGMAIAVGMLVDAGTVVLDACQRRTGSPYNRAVDGTVLVARAVIASAVTTAVVFVPALYLRHLSAAIFRQLALSLMVTLLASLAISLAALPALIAHLPASPRGGEDVMSRWYRRSISRIMKEWRWAAALTAVVCVATAVIGSRLPQRLLESEKTSSSRICFTFSSVQDAVTNEELAIRADAVLAPFLGQKDTSVVVIGTLNKGGPPLTSGWVRTTGESAMKNTANLVLAIGQLKQDLRVVSAGPVGGILDNLPLRPLEVDLTASTRSDLATAAITLQSAFSRQNIACFDDFPATQRILIVRPTAAGEAMGALLTTRLAFALPAPQPLETVGIRLREVVEHPDQAEGLPVIDDGVVVPFAQLARLEAQMKPALLLRHQGRPAARLRVGEALVAVDKPEGILRQTFPTLPSGVRASASGGFLDWREARSELVLAALLGFALVFLVMAALYESLLVPLVVLSVIPFALFGGAVALLLRGQGLDLASGLGFLLLIGLAVNNGVLVVDRLRHCGSGPAWWGRRASLRLRPVLVTTLTTLASLAPLAFFGGSGASLRASLALTTFAGLLVSTPAALFIVPPLARFALRGERVEP